VGVVGHPGVEVDATTRGGLHVVEDTGHGAFEERKDEFDGGILRFLDEPTEDT